MGLICCVDGSRKDESHAIDDKHEDFILSHSYKVLINEIIF
jgi:very-short-patch-repair endonuclease